MVQIPDCQIKCGDDDRDEEDDLITMQTRAASRENEDRSPSIGPAMSFSSENQWSHDMI